MVLGSIICWLWCVSKVIIIDGIIFFGLLAVFLLLLLLVVLFAFLFSS